MKMKAKMKAIFIKTTTSTHLHHLNHLADINMKIYSCIYLEIFFRFNAYMNVLDICLVMTEDLF